MSAESLSSALAKVNQSPGSAANLLLDQNDLSGLFQRREMGTEIAVGRTRNGFKP